VRRAASAALAVGALLVVGCGADDEPSRPAAWDGKPVAVQHPEIPGDDLVTGRVRNHTDHDLVLDSERARVLDANGRRVHASLSFAAAYTHDLYPPADGPVDGPKENPRFARERTGLAATIRPGETHPLTIAWHRRDGRPVRVDLGGLSLDLPQPVEPGASPAR
jgi:hypothetical protein